MFSSVTRYLVIPLQISVWNTPEWVHWYVYRIPWCKGYIQSNDFRDAFVARQSASPQSLHSDENPSAVRNCSRNCSFCNLYSSFLPILTFSILYNNLCTAFLQFRISFSVSSGCFLVPPLSMVFTILKPLHFRISLKAFTTPCV